MAEKTGARSFSNTRVASPPRVRISMKSSYNAYVDRKHFMWSAIRLGYLQAKIANPARLWTGCSVHMQVQDS
jgi:hypothetical protein